MEQERTAFEKRGIHVAAISYDSRALLAQFARRKKLGYPLLADPRSKMIRAFGILNENFPPGHEWYGVPFPGTFIVDSRGVVTAKYFEEDHRERLTAAGILVRQFNADGRGEHRESATRHLTVRQSASDRIARPGNRLSLLLDVKLKRGMHVYAPGVGSSYIPITWKMAESPAWRPWDAIFPSHRILHLPAIGERVPVYANSFRLRRDVTVGQSGELNAVIRDGRLTVAGTFRYQACDERVCYAPVSVPVEWNFAVDAHDGVRAPSELRRK